jgi:cysteine-rich repeat protein
MMQLTTVGRTTMLVCSIALATSCSDSGADDDGGPSACVNGEFCVGDLVCVGGFCLPPGGTESVGDGDGNSGDGDGDPGDGDGDPGDGDGDSGDGDGDPQPECGNGVVEADEVCDDGNANDDVCTNTCAWGPATRIVFVTSEIYTGNLGGLAGADAKCQSLADAAGLPGNYMAWLSTGASSPSTRFMQSPNPYVLVNGTKVADDWADLTDEEIDHPIDTDQAGNPSPEGVGLPCRNETRVVFTSTFWDGTDLVGPLDGDCQGWTTSSGSWLTTLARTTRVNPWSHGCNGPFCADSAGLYCFQQ